MKYLALTTVWLLLVGCGTSKIERLSAQCLAKDASFAIEVNPRTGLTKITVAAPRIGYSVKAGEISVIVPTNVQYNVQTFVFPPGVSNITAKPVPKTNLTLNAATNSVKKP